MVLKTSSAKCPPFYSDISVLTIPYCKLNNSNYSALFYYWRTVIHEITPYHYHQKTMQRNCSFYIITTTVGPKVLGFRDITVNSSAPRSIPKCGQVPLIGEWPHEIYFTMNDGDWCMGWSLLTKSRRHSYDRLRFKMGILIPIRRCLFSGPRPCLLSKIIPFWTNPMEMRNPVMDIQFTNYGFQWFFVEIDMHSIGVLIWIWIPIQFC